MENKLKHIFLSASIPSPERDAKYYETADIIGIRDAVRVLAATILPHARLVWGGHPSITPLIREVLGRVGVSSSEIGRHVTLYQSAFFEGMFPVDNECVEHIVLTQVKFSQGEKDRKACVAEMREQMLAPVHNYVAGIFIGGMEGVEAEYELFKEYHAGALILPIASTGGAALEIYNRNPANFDIRLKNDFDYRTLFNELLKDRL
ncbi:SLOG domain-containing protein [Phocaeicola sp.]|jgi:hypothetical protein